MSNLIKGFFNLKRKLDSWIGGNIITDPIEKEISNNNIDKYSLNKKGTGWEKKLSDLERKRCLWTRIGRRTKSKRIKNKQAKFISESY